MSIDDVINKIDNIESDDDLTIIEKIIRVIASNHRTLEIYELCNKIIDKCSSIAFKILTEMGK